MREDIPSTEPDCPNCGTRTVHRESGEYWCRSCALVVVGVDRAVPLITQMRVSVFTSSSGTHPDRRFGSGESCSRASYG